MLNHYRLIIRLNSCSGYMLIMILVSSPSIPTLMWNILNMCGITDSNKRKWRWLCREHMHLREHPFNLKRGGGMVFFFGVKIFIFFRFAAQQKFVANFFFFYKVLTEYFVCPFQSNLQTHSTHFLPSSLMDVS